MKKLLLIPFILLLSLTLVYAENLKATIEPQQEGISFGETAVFKLTIENKGMTQRTFLLEPVQQFDKWRVETPDPYILDIGASKVGVTTLKVTPLVKFKVGTYNQKLIIKTIEGTFLQEIVIPVTIIPFENAVNLEIIAPDVIDAREGALIKVMLENLYNYDLPNLQVRVFSDLFDKTQTIDLMIDDKKIKEFNFDLDPNTKSGNYLITAEVKSKDMVMGRSVKKVIISQYSDISEKTIKEEGLFSSSITVIKTNDGNTKTIGKTIFKLTSLQKLLSSYSTDPTKISKEAGQYILEWDFPLESKESFAVTVKTNYGILFLGIVILLVFIIIIYHLLSRKIVITKKIMEVRKSQDGISGIKVLLHIKNKSSFAFTKLNITDYLPKLVAPSKEFGTIHPTTVQRSPSGAIRVIWDIPRLERGEERIISYNIRSRLSIIGRFSLPGATVEYRNKKGRLIRVHSNRLTLLIPEEKRE